MESQAAESIGMIAWMARLRCLVSTLSRIGEAMVDAKIPANSNVAPTNPETSSEYPCGEKYWDERTEKVFTLQEC